MDALIEFGKILLPAGAVLYAMYLVVKSFLTKELEKKLIDVKIKNTDIVLPVRLQAYERLCLFLERISPNNLVVRLNNASMSAPQFHQVLIAEIRQEFNHNLSQQVYLSDKSWEMVKSAKEDVISVVNIAAEKLGEDDKSVDLAKKIFELMMEKNNDPIAIALKEIKDEIRTSF
ncbi:hypothetical protein QQ020_31235 [Fulvivirgaceae bacterium BMA12]|uniref:Uncharacterized protein n=1 Tax=Agaribacillus aureus TaxID=3051825 RepID=A0ABT8LFM8_9BACT|nr:hypothetical protein [Fulvivirgaceae bacterium BMA12]